MNDLRCGDGRPPSWLSNSDRLEEFLSGVKTLSFSRNIPDGYVRHVLANQDNFRRIISYTGALEARKSTFTEQQMAVADLILEWWRSHVRIETSMALTDDDETRRILWGEQWP